MMKITVYCLITHLVTNITSRKRQFASARWSILHIDNTINIRHLHDNNKLASYSMFSLPPRTWASNSHKTKKGCFHCGKLGSGLCSTNQARTSILMVSIRFFHPPMPHHFPPKPAKMSSNLEPFSKIPQNDAMCKFHVIRRKRKIS